MKSPRERNVQLINTVIKKIKKCCPTSVDLIGIAGSFANGDTHKGSDLDLLIVSNDDQARKIDSCFIINNIGFDFYCSPWKRLDDMANYNNPHVSKLFNLNIVYQRNEDCLNKYLKLRDICKSNLQNTKDNLKKAQQSLSNALTHYARLILTDDLNQCRKSASLMSTEIESSLYFLNNTYMKRGIRRVLDELKEMTNLPDNFIHNYQQIFESKDISGLKQSSTHVIQSVNGYLDQLNNHYRDEITGEDLTGTYEEIFSNWKNKMILAAKTDDKYLAFMTMSSCQQFYDQMSDRYDIPNIKIIQNFTPDDLQKTLVSFNEGMSKWAELYLKFKKNIKKYDSVEDFAKDYLSQT